MKHGRQTPQTKSPLTRKEGNHRYKNRTGLGVCVYCGEHGPTRDHVPPISVVDALGSHGDMVIVDCCHECNSLGSALPHKTVDERRAHLQRKLRSRYKKLLNATTWSEEELAELGPSMRRQVLQMGHASAQARRRVAFLSARRKVSRGSRT